MWPSTKRRADLWVRALGCAALLLIALTVVGCGNSVRTSAARSSFRAARSPHAFGAALWRFYRESGRQPGVANIIDHAEQKVLARCMRRAGFTYHPVSPEPVGGVVIDGLSNTPGAAPPPQTEMLEVERVHGFGIYQRFEPQQSEAPQLNSGYVASLGPAARRRYFLALAGDPRSVLRVTFPDGSVDSVPAGGCLGVSSKTVYGSVWRDDFRLNAAVDVEMLVERDVDAQPAMRAATRRWSRCMHQQTGHRFVSQETLSGWLAKLYAVPGAVATARRTEIHYSLQSTRCMYRTGAAARYASETWRILRHMPDAWYRALVEVHRWDAQALRTAKSVLRHPARTDH